MKLERVGLKKHLSFNEKWIQDEIAESSAVLSVEF
jgi:hypothetical protein